jgi:hypothetical protein
MDTDWALKELSDFIVLTELYRPADPPGVAILGDSRRPRGVRSDIVASAQVVEPILDRVIPEWRKAIAEDGKGRWQQHREAAQRAVVQIERAAEVAEKLGDNSPMIRASGFHPWVWEGARSLWQSGHYRESVRAAAVKVNAETQNKLGRRDVSEVSLFNEAFGAASGPGKLQLPGDDGGTTALSFRRGVRAFAEGCFAAIRNPASHDVQEELSEQEALEQLAAFSVLARWVQASELL